ncbi:hypothetical protein JTE90_005355 [Oedothorax gibbosus]|uniref:H15 domain-containing protein n=1 Tax=Oedothorax gibbosus TaxID=931172 RepID=A0AAV6UJQ1_9ARAC|nr:hypothetical protein JTE90_005355 [Oedothorax gibbosus]
MTVKHDEVFPKMTTMEWVLKAIETVGVPRKGASYIAILKWIVNNKENVVINRLKANLRKAIEKALENGLIKRPAISKDVTGLRGYFIKNKDAISGQKMANTKPVRKLVETTNVAKVEKTKTITTKTKASAQLKSKAAESTKPIKLLTKSTKPNRDVGAAGISSKPKTKLKSKAEKPIIDAVEGKSKNQIKAKTTKPTSSKHKILHKAVTQNPEAEAGPSNKHKAQPKSKIDKPTLEAIAEPSTKPKSRTRTTKPNLDAETKTSNKPKTQPKLKATKPNDVANAEPSVIPKTRAKTRTAKPIIDAESGPKTQPTAISAEPNPDVEVRSKTRPKPRAAKPSHDDKVKPKVHPKSIAFEINLDTETEYETSPKVITTESNPGAKSGPETHPRAIGNEPDPGAEYSSLLKTTPPKTKAAVKPRPGKHPVPVLKDILPHQKAASKTLKVSQKMNPKKLYKPSEELPLNISREEFSDKESNVKPQRSNVSVDKRNSYVSDSEVICNPKVAKATKMTKNLEVKKLNKKETIEAGSSELRLNRRRGKNNSADV